MDLVFDGPVIPVYNKDILDEYKNVLSRPKFRWVISETGNAFFRKSV